MRRQGEDRRDQHEHTVLRQQPCDVRDAANVGVARSGDSSRGARRVRCPPEYGRVVRPADKGARNLRKPRVRVGGPRLADDGQVMRNRFDELAKQLGEAALAPCGTTTTQDRINPETQFADLRHEPDPAREVERDRLGLLGRIAARPCMIEVYSRSFGPDELRGCLSKHLAFWQQRLRKNSAAEPPDLWILAAGAPRTLLAALHFEPVLGWPTGVYQFGGEVLRVYLVVVSEVPRDPTTLLVRLMAGGRLLERAMSELNTLPADTPARVVAGPVLLQFIHVLAQAPDRQPEEEEFIMAAYQTWEEIRNEGRIEGHIKACREMVRKLIVLKFGELPTDLEVRIANASAEDLDRFLERIVFADSLTTVSEFAA